MSVFGFNFWKEAAKSPDLVFELMQQDDCWFFDGKPKGYKWLEIDGPFKLFIPSQDRTITIYGLADKTQDSQQRIIDYLNKEDELNSIYEEVKDLSKKIVDMITSGLSSNDVHERRAMAKLLHSEVFPCLDTDRNEDIKKVSVTTLGVLIKELRPPVTEYEELGLDNAAFHYVRTQYIENKER